VWRWIQDSLIDQLTKLSLGGKGIAWHRWLGSGYSVDEERQTRASGLERLCQEAVASQAFVATADKTFCNRSVRYICQGCGYNGFGQNDLANDILQKLKEAEDWEEIPLKMVSKCSQQGELVVLGVVEQPHGHVVVGYPSPEQESSTWGILVPLVAHVGKSPNGIMRLSEAFSADKKGKVKAYRWEGSVA
jgi:hypothetical protein